MAEPSRVAAGATPDDGDEGTWPPYCCVILERRRQSQTERGDVGDGGGEPRATAGAWEPGAGSGVEIFCEVRSSEAKVEPGRVTCFGGKREAGELPAACVVRECHEELGWVPPGLLAPGGPVRACDLYVDGELIAWFYLAEGPPDDAALRFEPGRAGRWVRPGDPAISAWHTVVLAAVYDEGKSLADFVTPAQQG